MKARRATVQDTAGIFRLGCEMKAESATDFPEVESLKCAVHLALAEQNPERVFVGVVDDGERLVGVVNGTIGDYAFSTELRAAQDILFVTKDKRGTRAALLLMRAFLEWADANGAKTVLAGSSTGVSTEMTERFFTKFGFTPFCRTYRRGG